MGWKQSPAHKLRGWAKCGRDGCGRQQAQAAGAKRGCSFLGERTNIQDNQLLCCAAADGARWIGRGWRGGACAGSGGGGSGGGPTRIVARHAGYRRSALVRTRCGSPGEI